MDDDTLALSQAKSVGPRGHYLALDHTVSHCREQLWRTRYFGPQMPTRMSSLADRDLYQRIDADLRRILAEHTVADLPAPLLQELDGIRARFAASYVAS